MLQPAADAVKLFSNALTFLGPINKVVFLFSPILGLRLRLIFTILISCAGGGIKNNLIVLFFIILLRFNVYPLFGAGWASNRKYAIIGGLRAIAQTVAYEISLAFLVLSIFIPYFTIDFLSLFSPISFPPLILFNMLIFFMWSITVLAELNRTPFDFAEGESELVSGFNIEYGSVKFAMIFMAEYAIIFSFRVLSTTLLFNIVPGTWGRAITGVGLAGGVVWARVTLPRFRYDLLIDVTWKKILPWRLALGLLCRIFSLLLNI